MMAKASKGKLSAAKAFLSESSPLTTADSQAAHESTNRTTTRIRSQTGFFICICQTAFCIMHRSAKSSQSSAIGTAQRCTPGCFGDVGVFNEA